MSIDQQIAERFHCAKCGTTGAVVKRFAATGTGLSKMFDIQTNEFIAVSCQRCGFTELYNPDILESRDGTSDILDLLFGG